MSKPEELTPESQSCCACLSVRYSPIHSQEWEMPGIRERWCCETCGSEFVRASVRQQVARRCAEIVMEYAEELDVACIIRKEFNL